MRNETEIWKPKGLLVLLCKEQESSYKSQDHGNLKERYTWSFLSSDGTGLMWDTSKDLRERQWSTDIITTLQRRGKTRRFHPRRCLPHQRHKLLKQSWILKLQLYFHWGKKVPTSNGIPRAQNTIENQVLSNSLLLAFFWRPFLCDWKITAKSFGIAFFLSYLFVISLHRIKTHHDIFQTKIVFVLSFPTTFPASFFPSHSPIHFSACGKNAQWNFTQLISKRKVWTQHSIFIQLYTHPKGEQLSPNSLYQGELCSFFLCFPTSHPCLSRLPCA